MIGRGGGGTIDPVWKLIQIVFVLTTYMTLHRLDCRWSDSHVGVHCHRLSGAQLLFT